MTGKRVIVIGAGAGGMMAAGRAADLGADVVVLEKSHHPGQKILVSGRTRCNLSNLREPDGFILMYGVNGHFLYPAFHHFFREELLAFFQRYGVETKAERGGRIFPVSDDARDVVMALERYMAENKVRIFTGIPVKGIAAKESHVTSVQTEAQDYLADAVVLATGGASYPHTGSTGDGYRMAAALGHTIVKLRPALVPLVVDEIERAKSMQGVSLRNVRLTAYRCSADEIDPSSAPDHDFGRGIAGKQPRLPMIESRLGEMMMTHFGIGGPIVLRMSLAIVDALEHGAVSVAIDLKPGLDMTRLRQRLQRDFDSYGKRTYRNILKKLLPNKMVDPIVTMSGIPPETQAHQISAGERERLLLLLKSLRFNIKGPLPLSRAMVTAGGVSLKEINPRTLESHLVRGLYFCGEVMDIDADTGGYNLQAAFSTGYLAGEKAALFVAGES
ncbi:MAG: NAD(P)/FAD-dependent oxidoreductase [Chloroflexi bacterium]|nr:NAD(P)/FAD-dependent oxidoreductase [Chloroflexota bacterium]